MPTVTVRFFAGAAAAAGCKELALDADTVADVSTQLRSQFGPDFARVLDASSMLVDATVARGDLAAIPVSAGTTVDVLPPFAGG